MTISINSGSLSGSCPTLITVLYSGSFNATTNDGDGDDWLGVVGMDGNGNVSDNDWSHAPVGTIAAGFADGLTGSFSPTARPFRVRVYDINTSAAGIPEDSAAGWALALSGNLIAEATIDFGSLPGCADLPIVGGDAEGQFSGPPLPGPDARNLVLINKTVGVLSSPGGAQTGEVLKVCQTAFILETSPDGQYGRIYVMGGWIPLSATVDVAEDYGQPGGQPIRDDCKGH
ncbi:MAG: hypothetical protein KF716_03820 [Anaerolineae bacterium]|nr:hypothetical protein [Anaerolineae bacterium]